MSAPLQYVRPNQCRFCTSRACYYRRFSEDGTFDEISCNRHRRALEMLPGPTSPTLYRTSSSKQRRGGDTAAEFANFHRRLAEIEQWRVAQDGAA